MERGLPWDLIEHAFWIVQMNGLTASNFILSGITQHVRVVSFAEKG
jgi:hypothetical protein